MTREVANTFLAANASPETCLKSIRREVIILHLTCQLTLLHYTYQEIFVLPHSGNPVLQNFATDAKSFTLKSTRQSSNDGEFLYPKYTRCKPKRQRVQWDPQRLQLHCTRPATGLTQFHLKSKAAASDIIPTVCL